MDIEQEIMSKNVKTEINLMPICQMPDYWKEKAKLN